MLMRPVSIKWRVSVKTLCSCWSELIYHCTIWVSQILCIINSVLVRNVRKKPALTSHHWRSCIAYVYKFTKLSAYYCGVLASWKKLHSSVILSKTSLGRSISAPGRQKSGKEMEKLIPSALVDTWRNSP